jgi:hypothetical protein
MTRTCYLCRGTRGYKPEHCLNCPILTNFLLNNKAPISDSITYLKKANTWTSEKQYLEWENSFLKLYLKIQQTKEQTKENQQKMAEPLLVCPITKYQKICLWIADKLPKQIKTYCYIRHKQNNP